MKIIILQHPQESYAIGLSPKNAYAVFLNNWFIFTLQTLNPMTFHISLFVVAARKLRAKCLTHL